MNEFTTNDNANKKNFEKTIFDIRMSMPFFETVQTPRELEKSYEDKYATDQQKERDRTITYLLRCYVETYDDKRRSNTKYKERLFDLCVNIVEGFSFALFFVFVLALLFNGNASHTLNINNCITLITACITYITTIIGLLKIITKYVFPQKEEEYITRIVEIVQNNDLKHKKANIKAEIQEIKCETEN